MRQADSLSKAIDSANNLIFQILLSYIKILIGTKFLFYCIKSGQIGLIYTLKNIILSRFSSSFARMDFHCKKK